MFITRIIQAIGYAIKGAWLFCAGLLGMPSLTLIEYMRIPINTDPEQPTQIELLSSHDLTLRLVTACMAGNTKEVDTIIRKHGRYIDVNLFLDTIAEREDTANLGFWSGQSKAIRTALGSIDSIMWSETINRLFIKACECRSPLTVGLLVKYRGELTAQTIETGLIECHTSSPAICLRIFKHMGDDAVRFHAGDKRIIFSPTSLAIGWSVSQRRVTQPEAIHAKTERYVGPRLTETESYMHRILDNHYRLLPGVVRTNRHSNCMMNAGKCGHLDMIRALLQVESRLASQFIKQASSESQLEAVTMIAQEHKSALDHKDIKGALQTAIWSGLYETVDLLVELLGNDITSEMYTKLFNTMCNYRIVKGLELMLNRFRGRLAFDSGFTFDSDSVKKSKEIVSMLYASYGSQLTDQFPDWEVEA